jgi:hypothetical protein
MPLLEILAARDNTAKSFKIGKKTIDGFSISVGFLSAKQRLEDYLKGCLLTKFKSILVCWWI